MVYAESKEYHTILKVDHICTICGDCRLIRESCPGIDCAIEAGSDVTLPLFDVPVSYMVHSEVIYSYILGLFIYFTWRPTQREYIFINMKFKYGFILIAWSSI